MFCSINWNFFSISPLSERRGKCNHYQSVANFLTPAFVASKKLAQSIETTSLALRVRLKRLDQRARYFSHCEELDAGVVGEFISRVRNQSV